MYSVAYMYCLMDNTCMMNCLTTNITVQAPVLFGNYSTCASSSRDMRQMLYNYKSVVKGLGCMTIKGLV